MSIYLKRIVKFLFGFKRQYGIPKDWGNWEVWIIIPAYNESKSITKTLTSVLNQSLRFKVVDNQNNYPSIRILLVNDSSTDNTKKIAEKYQYMGVEVLTTPKNQGTKARAQNYAIFNYLKTKMVPGKQHFIVTIDGDTALASNALEELIKPMQDPQVCSACGFVIPQKVETFWERARLVAYLYDISISKEGQDLWGGILVSSGCMSVYSLEKLIEVGGFPEGTMVEDMELTFKLQNMKSPNGMYYRVALVSEAVCYPVDPPTWEIYKSQMMRWLRGYVQIIGIYRFKIFRRPALGVFAFWNLIDGISYIFVLLLAVLSVIVMLINASKLPLYFDFNSLKPILWIYLIQMCIGYGIIIIAVIREGIKHHLLKQAVIGLPFFFLVSQLNLYLFSKSIVLEWVLGRKLNTWEKGH